MTNAPTLYGTTGVVALRHGRTPHRRTKQPHLASAPSLERSVIFLQSTGFRRSTANKKRDRRISGELGKNNWTVLRIGEFEVRREPQSIMQRILNQRR
jgi:hypothetical protein